MINDITMIVRMFLAIILCFFVRSKMYIVEHIIRNAKLEYFIRLTGIKKNEANKYIEVTTYIRLLLLLLFIFVIYLIL